MGSAQAAIEPTAGQNASSAGSPWWRRFEAMWKEAGDGDQDKRDLRGALAIAQPVPGPIDRRRQRLHAVILDGAEIGERLQERQHHAGGNGGPRQRQCDAEEGAPRAVAQDTTGLDQGVRLAEECGARGEIDVRIEHQREQERDAAGRAEIGEPVVAAAPAGGLAQGALNGTGESQKIGIGIADDVGRQHQRQQQRPLQQPAAGEAAHRHQPRRAGADDGRAEADHQQQDQRVEEDVDELGVGEMPPQLALRREQARRDAEQRQRHDARDHDGADAPDHAERGPLARSDAHVNALP